MSKISKIREARETAMETLKDLGFLVILWSKEDIRYLANDREYDLTEEEIDEVFGFLENGHDATIGINWDVIDTTIDCVIENRKN